MLCAKCHQKEATIHFTTVVNGTEEEAVDLCKDCAPPTGFDLDRLDLKQLEALSVIGKKCEFCGKDACSGEMRAGGGAIYWCFDCGAEYGRIFLELLISEHPEFMERGKAHSSFWAFSSDPQLQAWSAEAGPKAKQMLKERRR